MYALDFIYCEILSILNIHILHFIALYIHGSNEKAIRNNNAGKDQFPTRFQCCGNQCNLYSRCYIE